MQILQVGENVFFKKMIENKRNKYDIRQMCLLRIKTLLFWHCEFARCALIFSHLAGYKLSWMHAAKQMDAVFFFV